MKNKIINSLYQNLLIIPGAIQFQRKFLLPIASRLRRDLLPIAYCILLIISLAACKTKQEERDPNVFYTCSMDPQVVEFKPGICPICKMELTKVTHKNTIPGEILLSDQQIQLGNIQTDTIRSGLIGDRLILTATLNFDETKVNSVSARIMGRIDYLKYKSTGYYVRKGDLLFNLYSEELNNAKQEYISVLERQQTLDNSIIDFKQLIQSAGNKLLLWGMTEAQVNELTRTKKTSPLTAFYSPVSGFITELPVTEGQYVMEGSTIVQLADLSTLWVEAQVYASQLAVGDYGGIATVQFPDIPGKEMKGKVEFANPEISPDTRINLIRITIPNSGNQLKPGMSAYVLLKSKQRNTLSLPVDAVLRNGKMASVWVRTGTHSFKNKMVQTGLETGDRIEIKSGLEPGEVVVTSGAYLLQSEYIFKKGLSPMAGHEH